MANCKYVAAKRKFQNNFQNSRTFRSVSYTHLRAHETGRNLVCRLLLEKKEKRKKNAVAYPEKNKKKPKKRSRVPKKNTIFSYFMP